MSIIQEIESKYRANPKHGVTFSIDKEAYESRIGDRITFGKNTSSMECGTMYNWQDICLDTPDNVIGYLEEKVSGRIFDPMCVSFCLTLADCMEKDTWEAMEQKYKDNPHFTDLGETLRLDFATLNQLLDHLKIK